MILHSSVVEQSIEGNQRAEFTKDLVVVRARSERFLDGVPLAMIRKRIHGLEKTKAAVMLVHGYGQNRYAWHLPSRSFFNFLVEGGFDVFNLELRGHGRSRHLGAHPPRDISAFVEEDMPAALAEVTKLSGHSRVVLVGHSLGGLVSYATAGRFPDLVGGVVSLGSPYRFTKGSFTLSTFGAMMLAIDRHVPLGHGAVELKLLSETMRLLRGFIDSPLFPLPIRGFARNSLEPKILSQHMALAMDTGSVAVLRHMFRSAAEAQADGRRLGVLSSYASAFERLDIPLLVIAGTKDDLAPPASVEPAYRLSRSTDKTYRAFPRGHIDLLVGRDCPHTIWPLVRSWIAERAALGGRLAA